METSRNTRRENRSRTLTAFLMAAICLVLAGADRALAAGMLVADGGFGGELEIVEHDVKVIINNGIAVTEVTQVFRNMEKRQVEALYTFPVPRGASVANFSMWINGREMVGEVVEKERARTIYNSYKERRRDPGLLEQKDYKTFEMRIFPIAAEARQKVQICYYQELDFDHDWATYVYPLATSTAKGLDNRVHGRFSVGIEVKSAIPVTAMESPSHGGDFLMVEHTDTYQEASLENRDGDLARDVVLAYQVERPVTGLDLIASKEKGEDGYFMLTLTAGQELAQTRSGADYVFILDISGSMADQGKLDASVNSLAAFMEGLSPEDRFEVITFNKRPNTLFGQLMDAGQGNMGRAVSFLRSQEAVGGTILQPALATAYKYGNPDRILNTVILSDGMTEQNERRVLMEMIKDRPANVRVFCIGVGNEINRSLLGQMAEDAGGLAAFISRGDDFKRQARAFRRKLLHPVATDLAVEISGMEVYDLTPATLPNLYYGMPVKLFGRYRGEGPARLNVSGTVNGRKIGSEAELAFPAADDANPEIERMWAWHRMEGLKREHEVKNSPRLVEEIVRLGEVYSITSEYTSFLVLENDAEYRRWKIERRNSSRIKRDRAARERLSRELAALREKALAEIGPAVEKDSRTAAQAPQAVNPPAPAARPQAGTPPQTTVRRGVDLPSLGGGAMDPLSGLIGIAMAGGAFLARRRKK